MLEYMSAPPLSSLLSKLVLLPPQPWSITSVGKGPPPLVGSVTSTSSGTPSWLATRVAGVPGQKRTPKWGAQARPSGVGTAEAAGATASSAATAAKTVASERFKQIP